MAVKPRFMNASTYLQKEMARAFIQLKAKNPRYSLRAFSKRLALSPSAVSELLNGKRKLSRKKALVVAERLLLPPDTVRTLKSFFIEDTLDPQSTTHQTGRKALDAEYYSVIAEWQYYAILNLIETQDFKSDPQWIAQRLGLTEKKVETCIQDLLNLDLIKKTPTSLKRTYSAVTSSDDIVNLSLRKRHEENLYAARDSLSNDDLSIRDFTFATMAIDPDRLPLAKKLIREFENKLIELLEGGNRREVYELCVQMFPRTKGQIK